MANTHLWVRVNYGPNSILLHPLLYLANSSLTQGLLYWKPRYCCWCVINCCQITKYRRHFSLNLNDNATILLYIRVWQKCSLLEIFTPLFFLCTNVMERSNKKGSLEEILKNSKTRTAGDGGGVGGYG